MKRRFCSTFDSGWNARVRQSGFLALCIAAGLVLGGCAQTTYARDVFGDETVLTQDLQGLVEVSQSWLDGKRGGIAVKPNSASAGRKFEPAPGFSLEAGFAELVASAVEDGWVESGPTGAQDRFFTADKGFPEGPGSLIISVDPSPNPSRILVSMVLDN